MKTLLRFALGCALLAGCTEMDDGKPDESDVKGGVDGKAEAWGPSDSPALFNSSLEYSLAALPLTGQATNIPWAGNYWPVAEDSINHKWDGAQSQSASAKYGAAFGVADVENAVSKYHGIDAQSSRKSCTASSECDAKIGETCSKRAGAATGRCIPTWWGICHAWAPAAILLPEPKFPVTHNGVTFKVQDIKALLTLVHNSTTNKFVSLRCDTDAAGATGINFDNYGRPTAGDASCRDTNPGTFHVLLTNYLGKQGLSFVEDRTYDDEVWNQPLRGYRITKQQEVTALEANKLIGVTTGGSTVDKTGTVAKNAWVQLGSFTVTGSTTFKAVMTGTGDADLYVHFGAQPTASAYTCRPYGGDSNETCDIAVPAGATTAYVAVNGYADSSNYSVKITSGGTTPTAYAFNPNAAKLYSVKSEVDYISESSASTDGNLGATINQYTHTDHYQYILEVDAAGKIVGGEWVGESKTNHPDFVWLPVAHKGDSVAGGKITFANVKAIYDKSMIDPNQTGPVTGADKVVTDAATVTKAAWKHYGPYNVAAGATFTATMTGSGDADLYVRKTAAPTTSAYECRPYQNGSNESCSIVGPAVVYVGVNGYADSSSYSLEIKYKEGAGGAPVTPPPATFTHLNQSGSVTQGQMKLFQLPIPAGKKVVVRTTAPSDVDLYIMMDAAPTTSAYTMRGYTSSGNETITYTATSNGVLNIGVYGYAASSFTVKTSDM